MSEEFQPFRAWLRVSFTLAKKNLAELDFVGERRQGKRDEER